MATWIGIDIGTTAVKVAVIQTAYRKVQLQTIASCDLAAVSAATGGAGGIPDAIRGALAAATATGGGPREKVGPGDGFSTALEGARVAIRQLSLPLAAQKQIGDVLPFELESMIPFDIAESVWDWRVMNKLEGQEGQVPILAAVARTEDVRARIALIKSAINVEPERVGVGGFPLCNMMQYSPQLAGMGVDGPLVVVDLGTLTSEVLILRDGEPLFARAVSFGTQGLPGTAPRLAREIRTTIAAFRAIGGVPPAKIILCGGGSFVSGAEAFLSGELELPVEVLAPPQLDLSSLAPDQVAQLPRFAKAVGLALGLSVRAPAFDLRKGPLAFERGFAWIKEKIPVLAGIGAVIVVSFFFTAWAQLYAEGKEHDTLEKALSTVTKDVLGEETNSAPRAQELLGQQTAINDEDPLPHADAFDVMVKLSEDIPQSMVHDIEELDVQKGHAVVHGIVGTIPDAQAIATSLRNEKCFQEVKITRTNQMVGTDRQKYVMEFDVKCPEDTKGGGKKKDTNAASSASGAPSAGGK